jgi:hypothetical protein
MTGLLRGGEESGWSRTRSVVSQLLHADLIEVSGCEFWVPGWELRKFLDYLARYGNSETRRPKLPWPLPESSFKAGYQMSKPAQ